MHIYPSILELSKDAFEEQFKRVLPHFSHFQLDIVDGQFVPNRTVQIEEIVEVIRNLGLVVREKTFEFHLMVRDYEAEIEKIKQYKDIVKVTAVLIHIQALTPNYKSLSTDHRVGLVLNPDDDVTQNWEILKTVNPIQLMTIYPGAQGNPFMPETLTKIDQLRERGFSGEIILDGGINDETLPLIMKREHVPDAVCPGSYFKEDVEYRLRKLEEICK